MTRVYIKRHFIDVIVHVGDGASPSVQINDDILVRLARLVDVRRNSVLHLDLFEIY